jgi:membrane-associated protease RseP (regulator of RpoE activity)
MNSAGIIGVVVFLLGVLASIALHEVGHLVPAKRFGVRVSQYMVGFGPTVWSRVRGETEYGFKAIPLGGYIRMIGMFPPARDKDGNLFLSSGTASSGPFQGIIEGARRSSAEEIEAGEEHRAFYQLSVPKKLVVMLGGPTMNLLIALVLFTIAMVGLGVAQPTPTVATVAKCIPASGATKCTPSDQQSPAAAAGLKKGDQIVAVDGRSVDNWDQLVGWIRDQPGDTVTLSVVRDGHTITVPVTIGKATVSDLNDPDKMIQAGYLGVAPTIARVRQPVTAVPGQMWQFATMSGKAVLSMPSKMAGVWGAAFDGQQRDVNGPMSLVGVSRVSAEVADDQATIGWKAASMLVLLASLNMALFLFNLIPLLPLDGGHVAGALYEGGRRQVAKWRHRPDPGPVDVARMLPVAYTVAVLLIVFSGLLIYADIVNPIRLSS